MAKVSANEAYQRLVAGNERFVRGEPSEEGRDAARLKMLARSQEPFAAVLCCADSRVVPEIVFDSGLGELFVLRVAGNVANRSTVASLEFAIQQLHTRLVVVMAHANCGAVTAALADISVSANLRYLLDHIQPAVDRATDRNVDAVARLNATLTAERLAADSEIIREATAAGSTRIVTAFYHPGTGQVELG